MLVLGATLNSRQMAKEVRDSKKRDLNLGAFFSPLMYVYCFLWRFYIIYHYFQHSLIHLCQIQYVYICQISLCIIYIRVIISIYRLDFHLAATLGVSNDLVDVRKKKQKIMYIARAEIHKRIRAPCSCSCQVCNKISADTRSPQLANLPAVSGYPTA